MENLAPGRKIYHLIDYVEGTVGASLRCVWIVLAWLSIAAQAT